MLHRNRRPSLTAKLQQATRSVVSEALEPRSLFSVAYPTATEQYLVQLINRARANATAEVKLDSQLSSSISRAGWVVSTNATTPESPSNAVDGNLGTRFSTDANQTPGQYVEVDMGSAQSFNSLTMDAGTSSTDYPRGYSVYVSNTDTDWSTSTPIATGVGTTAWTPVNFASQTARYVRIVQTGSNSSYWWSIAELNIGTQSSTSAQWGGQPDLNEGLPAGTLATTAFQPLAVDPYLTDAAEKHSAAGLSGSFSHTESTAGYVTATDRVVTAGYTAPANFYVGENIAVTTGNSDINAATLAMNQGLFVDNFPDAAAGTTGARGHRLQELNGLASLVGAGVATDGNGTTDLTEDFTNVNNQAYLTGVTYNDANGNNFYDPGEGLGSVTVTATRISDQQVFSTTTWAAGGYTLPLASGAYTVTVSGGNIGTPVAQTVVIGTQNVEADFLRSNTAPPAATNSAPTILQSPASVSLTSKNVATFTAPGPATFTVAATGTPAPTYQWQVSVAGGAFTNISGATSAVYSFTPSGTEGGNQYQAVVTNSQGTVTSSPATLTLGGLATRITTPPSSQTVNPGDTVTLTSAGTGSNLAINWQSLQTGPGSTYSVISGATSANYTFTVSPSMAGGTFFFKVTYANTANAYLVDQAVAVITVNAAPVAPAVVAQPIATAATAGSTATLALASTAYPSSTIQWQVASNATATPAVVSRKRLHNAAAVFSTPTFVDVAGLTGASVTFPVTAGMNGTVYRAVITNISGQVTSQTVKLSVNDESVVANELANLKVASAAALASIQVCANAVASNAKTISADLKRLDATQSQKSLVTEYAATDKRNRAALKRKEAHTLSAAKRDAVQVETLYAKLQKKPGNSVFQSRLQIALTKLQTDAAANTVSADSSQCWLGQLGSLNPILAVAPHDAELQTDLANAQDSSDTIAQSLQAPMTLVLGIVSRLSDGASA